MMDFTAQLRIGVRVEPSDVGAERKNQMELMMMMVDGCRIYHEVDHRA